MAVGRRTDQQLIHPARLAELEELAQDGSDMRAAIKSLETKRLQMMERIRVLQSIDRRNVEYDHARGWIEYESDLGDALLAVQRKRGEEAPF